MATPETTAAGPSSSFSLYRRFPRLAEETPRLPLGQGGSPVSRLEHLSAELGADVWLKNDGLYGVEYGGNKTRKLEFILADALRRESKTILTAGGIGTNHGLATALYGRKAGLNVGLFLGYEDPTGEAISNLLVTATAGAEIHYTGSYPMTALQAPYWVGRYWLRDHKYPYVLGPGGSSPLAALGYVNAAFELAIQVKDCEIPAPDAIVLPLGTGGTVAGLVAGLRLAGLDSRVIAVAIGHAPTSWTPVVMRLARRTLGLVASKSGESRVKNQSLENIDFRTEWIGRGLGQPSKKGKRAAARLNDLEGLALDPVYTAKAMAALIDLVDAGSIQGNVLFWHTHNMRPLPAISPNAAGSLPRPLRRVCNL